MDLPPVSARIRATRFPPMVAAAALAVALVACSGEAGGPEPTWSSGQGGGTPPMYAEPVPLVDGDYLPADYPFDELAAQGALAEANSRNTPVFEGTVAEVRLYSSEHALRDPSFGRKQCVVGQFREATDLEFTYLPGGTYANGPQFAGVCEDREIAYVMQEFTTKHGSFNIIFAYGEPALGHDAPVERVHVEKIGDHDAVVIDPLIKEGFGRGWAAYATGKGVVMVDGHNLPTGELVRIAGGVECSVC